MAVEQTLEERVAYLETCMKMNVELHQLHTSNMQAMIDSQKLVRTSLESIAETQGNILKIIAILKEKSGIGLLTAITVSVIVTVSILALVYAVLIS